MNKYLVKVAEKAKDKPVGNWGKFGIHLGTQTAADIARAGIATAGIHLMTAGAKNKSEADKHTLRQMIKDHKLNVTFNPNKLKNHGAYGGGIMGDLYKDQIHSQTEPAYMHTQSLSFNKNYISGKKSKMFKHVHDALAHEVGHAIDFKNAGKLKHELDMASRTLSTGRLKGVSSIATIAAGTNEKTRKYAPAIPLALAAPMLHSEAMANYHAAKGIAKHKGLGAAARFVGRTVLPNTLNYAAGPVALAAGAYGANKLIDHINKKRRDGK